MLTILYHILFYLKRVTENDAQNEVVFDDKDELWTELKHQHIYNVAE